MPEPGVWVVRGGDYNELASQVKVKQAVAIGWAAVGDVSKIETREELKTAMEEADPGSGTPNSVGQVFRFAKEIEPGDYILTPEKLTAEIHVSRCKGPYRCDPTMFSPDYPQVRPVEYLKPVPRSFFPQSIRNTLGSTLTVFRADVALPYLQSFLGEGPAITTRENGEPVEAALWADEIEGQARGQVLEALDDIEHHDFQVFVAGLLAALGYKTRVGKKGADGGVDVLAYPDAFGLAAPRIKVQVKNQKSSAGIQEVGYLNGVLGAGERGLFICTGGFTKDAENAPFVRNGQVALVDGQRILNLVLEHYESLPDSATSLLPLRKVYVPEKPATG
ncbi:MAG: restriction endonuclease [Dehalococcoidia bacterium]